VWIEVGNPSLLPGQFSEPQRLFYFLCIAVRDRLFNEANGNATEKGSGAKQMVDNDMSDTASTGDSDCIADSYEHATGMHNARLFSIRSCACFPLRELTYLVICLNTKSYVWRFGGLYPMELWP